MLDTDVTLETPYSHGPIFKDLILPFEPEMAG
jgi:hypothetical protein